MAPLIDTGIRPLACLLSEASGHRSRENIALKADSGMIAPNTVLAEDATEPGKYVPAAAGATAIGIALYGGDTSEGEVFVPGLMRDAEVNVHTLIFAPDVDTAEKRVAKIAQLRAVGIIAR
ncbi:head decoration protein [Paracoccus sp. SY]|uniref:head decoration protein n=1 Tax=Paracoccus sp. SY TaxID=1330255 RepID=UPI000CD07D0F|nr:head decoration protein [Paracoccus sp. SY]